MPAKYKENTPRAITPEQWVAFATALRQHGNITEAARMSGISRSQASRAVRSDKTFPLYRRAKDIARGLIPEGVKDYDKLDVEASRAVEDFSYFRLRYFGRVATPWATHTAKLVAQLLETPQKEYVVVNEPPGVGKSTFWTIDLPAWLICRNRGVRIQLGSAAQTTAEDYVQQLRREFERDTPLEADPEEKRKGLALDAVATLIDDFGGFKPPRGEPWTTKQFVVKQVGDKAKGSKEATVRALGRDTKFLGKRCDLIVWDDLVDESGIKTIESREDLKKWWFKYAETRLEPEGLCVLQGQRLHADDLYQEVVKIKVTDFADDSSDDAEGWGEPVGVRNQYIHVKYKAHYDEHCRREHNPRTAPAYDPDQPHSSGCLLDPKRLTFRDCMTVKDKDARLYAVSYQQEDIDPASVLVNPLWVSGGTDPDTGENFPGCWDKDRSMGTFPKGLTRPWLSLVTADPSPSKFWSIQWWAFHWPTGQRFLLDHARKAMGANDFLDYIISTGTYDGLLEEWWARSKSEGAPISHVVVEQNAAQRFLLQYDHVRNWSRTRHVTIVPHDTYANKTHKEYGIQALLPQQYKYGAVRLPTADSLSRGRSMALVNEVTRYPEVSTDDCVMAHWFAEINAPKLRRQVEAPPNPPVMTHRVMSAADFGVWGTAGAI